MVLNHNFQDLFGTLNEIKALNLPTHKENMLQINYTKFHEPKTIYKDQEPPLPFAASPVFNSPISKWRRLAALDDKCKAVYEVTFDIRGSNIQFRPGDTIGIVPQNNHSEIVTLIEKLNLKNVADSQYSLITSCERKGAKIPLHLPVESTLRHVLTHCVDLRAILKKLFLLALSRYTKDDNEKRILEYLCSKEGSIAYTEHILNKRTSLLDILTIFKSCKPPIEMILEHLPRLLPRPYSIVNSGYNDHNVMKICFSVMEICNNIKGLTTGWLEELMLKHDSIEGKLVLKHDSVEETLMELNLNDNVTNLSDECKISLYLRHNVNEFSLPQNLSTSIILIGLGTGVAPYIGFLEEREHLRKSNPDISLGYAWLFFGCRNPKLDFIYEEELNYFVSQGVLNKLTTSFSRDGNTENCYVQDAITRNGEELCNMLLDGAHVYLCGDINKMATSVKTAITQCLVKYADKTYEEAELFLSNMLKEKKYLTDIWN